MLRVRAPGTSLLGTLKCSRPSCYSTATLIAHTHTQSALGYNLKVNITFNDHRCDGAITHELHRTSMNYCDNLVQRTSTANTTYLELYFSFVEVSSLRQLYASLTFTEAPLTKEPAIFLLLLLVLALCSDAQCAVALIYCNADVLFAQAWYFYC